MAARVVFKENPEETLAKYIEWSGNIPLPEREYRFCEVRDWCFDFAWPLYMLAVEVDGGTFSNGRHVRGVGYENDCYKLNEATQLGWHVMRFTSRMVFDNVATVQIERYIKNCQGLAPLTKPPEGG